MTPILSSIPTNRLQRNARIRVFGIIMVAFVAVGLFGMFTSRANARASLIDNHELVLSDLERRITAQLDGVTTDLAAMASENAVRQYALGVVNPNTSAESNRDSVLLAFLGLLDQHAGELVAVRYVAADGAVRSETVHAGSGGGTIADVTNAPSLVSDSSFNAAMREDARQVVIGSMLFQIDENGDLIEPLQPIMRFSTPVRYLDTLGTVLGVLQIDMDATRLLNIVNDASTGDGSLDEGRRVILLNSQDQFIADSGAASLDDIFYISSDPSATEQLVTARGLRSARPNDDIAAILLNNDQDEPVREQGNNLISSLTLNTGQALDMPWQLVLVDDATIALREQNANSALIPVLSVLLGFGVSLLVTSLLRNTLKPYSQATLLMQQLIKTPEMGGTAARQGVAAEDELSQSITQVAKRLEKMNTDMERQRTRLTRNLEIAARISRETAMLNDLDALLNRVINLICEEFGFYHAQVFVVDDIGLNAVLVYSRGEAGQKLLAQEHKLAVGSDSVIGRVTDLGRPVIVNDVAKSPKHHAFNPILTETRAEMALPLFIGERVIGALDIQSNTPDVFRDEDLQAFQLLADQLAIAINSGQLLMQSEERVRQIDSLNRQLTRSAWSGDERPLALERIYHYDLRNVGAGESPQDSEEKSESISLPIRIRGEVIGSLDVAMPDDNGFSEGDQAILRAVTDRVALAIENARLFQETQLTLNETSTLYDLSRAINEAEDLEEILSALITTVMPDALGGQVLEFDDYPSNGFPQWVTITADWSARAREWHQSTLLGLRWHVPDYRFLSNLQPNQVTLVTDIERDARIDEELKLILRSLHSAAMVMIPLNMRGLWRGLVMVEFPEPRRFQEQEGRVYTALIDQAGVAVDNRLLLRQTEATLDLRERMYGASRGINTAQTVADLVRAVMTTSSDTHLNFAMSLLEGELNEYSWPKQERMTARSEGGQVFEVNEVHDMYVSFESPMHAREPEIIIDNKPDAPLTPILERMRHIGWHYAAVFPLFSANQPVALFYVTSTDNHEMSSEDYEVYKALTGQMSTVLQNRRLLEQTEQALDESRRLYSTSRAITSATDASMVYQASVENIAALSDLTTHVMILLVGPNPVLYAPYVDFAHVWARDPQSSLLGQHGQRVSSEEAPYARLADELGGLVQVNDLSKERRIDADMLQTIQQDGAASLLIAPLQSRQKAFGVLVCQSSSTYAFDEQFVRFAQAVADQVAISVENRQLFEEAQSEAQRALALAEVGQLAARIGTEFRRNISEVFATVANAAGYDRWLLVLSEDGSERLEQITRRMPGFGEASEGGWFDLNTARHSLVDAARDSRLIMVNNPSEYPAFSNMNEEALEFIGKHIAAPVRVGTQTVGALLVGRSLDNADLTDRDEQLVSTLAAQVSVAVENRRLFLSAETERKTLSSILDTMPSGVLVLDAQTLLPTQSNAQIEALLGRVLVHDTPFDASFYNLYRTGTQLHYNNADLPIYQAASNGSVAFADDIVVIQPDGTQVDLLMNAAPIRDARGAIVNIVAAMQNISSLRGLENALQDNLRETIALYEATRALSTADEIDNVLDTLVAQLSMMESSEAGIVLLDENTEQLSVARTLFSPPEEWILPASVLKHRQMLFIGDVSYHPQLDDETREMLQSAGIAALVSIPLRARSRELPLGWVVTTYTEAHMFTAEEERFLTTLSDSAANALDNRYLFLSTQDALQEASTLYQASRSLTNATTHEDILNAVIDYLVHPDITSVFVAQLSGQNWDAPSASADVMASWRVSDDTLDMTGVVLSQEHFLAWRLLSTRQTVMINDIETQDDLDDLERAAIESMGLRAVVVLPLRVGNRALGAIWLGSDKPYTYTERDSRVFQSFAEQTSITLEASRLLNQTDRRARQLQTSSQVSQAASSILELDDLLPRLVNLIQEAFSYDHVQIFLMDREDEFAVLRASTGDAGKQMLAANHKLQKGSRSVIGAVIAENRAVIALDTGQADVVHRPNPYLPNTRSEIGLPLVVKDKVVGAIDVQSNQQNAFGDDDIAVLTTLAAQISVAIDNARLFEQSERRANDMSLLFAVTTAAASAETLSGALQNVAEDLRDSLDALSVSIYLPRHYIDDLTEEEYTLMHIAAAAGTDQPLSEISEIKVGDPRNLIGTLAANFRSIIINRIEDEPLYLPLVSDAHSAVAVPLTSAGELIGLITMENAEFYAYSHETLTLLQTMGGTLSAIIENAQLLEQVQKSNDQLKELDRIKSEFLANMSHELRTPLNSIIGFSRVILKGIDGPLTEMQEQDLTTIYNSGQHLLGLINDILDQAKIASGKMDLKLDYFEIKAVVEGVRSIGIGLVKDKPININVDVQSGLPRVYGDEFRTRQVLLNLISNASKFTTEGGITIGVYTVEEPKTRRLMVRVDVVDSGIGIAESDMPLLFEPFRQVDSSLTRTAGGTGLGLPISRSLVEMQGGEMYVRSQINVGSTFSITIPTQPAEEKKKKTTGSLSPDDMGDEDEEAEVGESNGTNGNHVEKDDTMRLNRNQLPPAEYKVITSTMSMVLPPKRQVLLIEDNPDRVDQFRRAIQREGFDVFTATIPLEAEAMASGLRPTLIIMDVNFSNGAGWNILAKLQNRDDTFDIPVIVVTLSNERERALALGTHTFLQHPITPEDLVAAVAEAEKESSTERILIIDDQPESTRLLTQLLDEHGQYRVFAAHNGAEGVSMVARRRPDLVLLDLRMPEMDGFAVLQELRSNPETANIPVLIVTGDTLDAAERDRLADTAVLYKTDISYEDYRDFIQGVRTHLSRNGE